MPRPLDDAPDDLLEQARLRLRAEHRVNRYEEQSRRLARRLVIAFILIVLTGVVFFIVVPLMGVHLPLIVPVLCFVAIVVGAVIVHAGEAPEEKQPCPRDDEGRPIGCCPGPRPLRGFRDQPPSE